MDSKFLRMNFIEGKLAYSKLGLFSFNQQEPSVAKEKTIIAVVPGIVTDKGGESLQVLKSVRRRRKPAGSKISVYGFLSVVYNFLYREIGHNSSYVPVFPPIPPLNLATPP